MKPKYNSLTLKLIAIITMTLDHIAIFFFKSNSPIYYGLRAVGRISFPIFAFLLTVGYFHTTNLKKYLGRLISFALITEIIYDYSFYNRFYYSKSQNIFFTLTLGLITIYLLDKTNKLIKNQITDAKDQKIILLTINILIISLASFLSALLNLDYSIIGIIMISTFYLFKNKYLIFITLLLTTLVFASNIQLYSLISLYFIFNYQDQKMVNHKYFFYCYYPFHLLILKLLKTLIG